MNRAIFCDRDNTLVLDEKGYLHKLKDLVFLPGVIDGLKKLQKRFLLIIVTNQSGIGRGYYKEGDYFKFRDNMHNELRKNGIEITAEYFCPHHPENGIGKYKLNCNCRKPKTGMFEEAKEEHNIDFSKSWMIGDKIDDIKSGKNIGAKTIGIISRESTIEELEEAGADFIAADLREAVNYIVK